MMARRLPQRIFGVAIAVLAAQLAGIFHLAFVRHTRCVEHGEMIDVGDRVVPAQADRAEPEVVAAVASDAHGHDHCVVGLGLRSRAAPSQAQLTSALCRHRLAVVPRATGVLRFSMPPLSFAPKHSPPSVV